MPVDFPDIGARLAAYAHTKATITTFRLVTKYTTQSACHDLPEEIISLIADNVREIVFTEKIARWMWISECLAGLNEEYSKMRGPLCYALTASECRHKIAKSIKVRIRIS